MKKKQTILIISIIVVIMIILGMVTCKLLMKNDNPLIGGGTDTNVDFDYKIIKEANKANENYLISPLSIGYALHMLEDGAKSATRTEINKVLNNYSIPDTINIENKISIANALFVKNTYQNAIKDGYVIGIKKDYGAEIIYDEFKTPDVINNWVKEKTYEMIPTTIDQISNDFVLALVNTIAIDIEWQEKFMCSGTRSDIFTKEDGTKINAAMMHTSDDVTYFKKGNAQGIIKDYRTYNNRKDSIELEYIAILPDGNLQEYINNFDKNELDSLLSNTKNNKVNLAIPKYTYDYTFIDFQKSLNNLGIIKAFNSDEANFSNIIDDELYVSQAIHKTHIEFSENGTKAAAVTAFTMDKNSMETEEIINIEFNRPFLYIIKDKNTDNIWFFGTVYQPMQYKNSTCTSENY